MINALDMYFPISHDKLYITLAAVIKLEVRLIAFAERLLHLYSYSLILPVKLES